MSEHKQTCYVCNGAGYTISHDTGAYSHDFEGNCFGYCPIHIPCAECNGKGTIEELLGEQQKRGGR